MDIRCYAYYGAYFVPKILLQYSHSIHTIFHCMIILDGLDTIAPIMFMTSLFLSMAALTTDILSMKGVTMLNTDQE